MCTPPAISVAVAPLGAVQIDTSRVVAAHCVSQRDDGIIGAPCNAFVAQCCVVRMQRFEFSNKIISHHPKEASRDVLMGMS